MYKTSMAIDLDCRGHNSLGIFLCVGCRKQVRLQTIGHSGLAVVVVSLFSSELAMPFLYIFQDLKNNMMEIIYVCCMN